MTNYSGNLRKTLQESAKVHAEESGSPYFPSRGGTIIFERYADGTKHGNFFDPSFQAILARPDWKTKLLKPHSKRFFMPENIGVKVLDSSNSSDALLMNIFCDPALDKRKVRRFFDLHVDSDFVFAHDVFVRRQQPGHLPTEIDLFFGDIYLEGKLTEPSLTTKKSEVVEAYDDLEATFDLTALPQRRLRDNYYLSYQLIRNVLAAEQDGKRFWLAVDARRPDWVKAWIMIMNAIKHPAVRRRCGLCFWQELVEEIASPQLQSFLRLKYSL